MEQKHRFAIVAAILTLLCLIIQIHAVRLLMTPSQENPPSKSAEPSEENTVQSVATEQDEVGKKGVDDTAHRSRKLEKLDALEDFMAFSASELQMGEAIRENNLPHDSWLMIDTTKANWREKKDKLLADRQKWLADAMDMLEKYIEEEDFSVLSQEEYEKLLAYRDNLRQWSEIAYRDDVDLETKIAAFKQWYVFNSNDNNQEIPSIVDKQFNAAHGDMYKKYATLYDRSGIEQIWKLTNPWWINRTMVSVRDTDGKQHHYRVKLYDE